jgi:two-component system, LytTR family, response regulator
MELIKSIIVDDEPGNIITLTELLKEHSDVIQIIATAKDCNEAFDVITNYKPQLVFLDIEMPYGNAFDLLEKLMPINFEVIFITAFNNYAIKAFKYAAVDYILKPINIQELKEAISRVKNSILNKNINTEINHLLQNVNTVNTQKIGFPTALGFQFEHPNNIMYLKAEGSYTYVYIKGKAKELISKNLKEMEAILPENIFCRVHNSSIINMSFIKKYYKGRGGYVEMEDGATIEIATRKKDIFFEKFKH